ncbi:MAG: LemA family protein [Erysipelotrichaceae bacterium]|jgi:LemA protein|nr:LemA family protein [Erysipelotrichaceae bacterium]
MANELDETNPVINEAGRDVNVIDKQIPIKVGTGSKIFEIVIWFLPVPIISGLIYLALKVGAGNYLSRLQQKIQHDASEIDNYLEQRVIILKNVAALLEKSIKLDKETFAQIAGLRAGNSLGDMERVDVASKVDNAVTKLNAVMENYPELRAHNEIQSAMNQNSYLQKEITAARSVYNDTVNQWNQDIYRWPLKMIVAAKRGYTTRIPFIASQETKAQAREVFF